jgi:A/G-specific adenine glycosylase
VPTSSSPIAAPLTAWAARSGRHDLPWQRERTPYRVWVSEIMLQQTQVSTVVPYFERFMARFPEVGTLAAAALDEVLHLWSGLGYYARARNLHRAAQRIRDAHGGQFPREFAAVAALPGIGRSTAGAILALACDQRYAILDGNARRVLARYFDIRGPVNEAAVQGQLWQLAERCTPATGVAAYTQAIMDLGATLCVRSRPQCPQCPLVGGCAARAAGRERQIPAPRRGRARRQRQVFMVVALRDSGEVLLERRPERGIWGGLWCLPQFESAPEAHAFIGRSLGQAGVAPQPLQTIEHAFTHFDLAISPLLVRGAALAAVHEDAQLWYNIRMPARIGLPAPITTLLAGLAGVPA